MFRSNFVFVWLAIALTMLSGCFYPKATPEPTPVTYAQDITIDTAPLYTYAAKETNFTIGPFDRMAMKVWRYEDLSGEILVKEDGSVFVPNVGFVDLNGLTLREAHTKLTAEMGQFVKNPQVDLAPIEVRSKRYYIMGAVRNPGGYPIFKPMTLQEAVSLSGGSTDQSLLEGAYLKRKGKVYPIDLQQAFNSEQANIYLLSGDMLYIPSKAEATVYVLGEVDKPGAYSVAGGLDVMQAVAQAGGYNAGADEDEIGILRRKGDKFQLQVVNLEDAVKYAAGNPYAFRLKPGDIVWVPPMGIASWNRGLAMITPSLDLFLFKPLAAATNIYYLDNLLNR